ncbi:hypothetical protein A1O1_02855 [Capronia coronata CBS 617.96]|uniref:Uncharacterized protein n=1 Tax=Capronia coronata CBS 617.96 TaxID=1182541 RepID=W9ZIZ1_9EURO|nr:uncharacterized protein A1O1_02855 [Capronia coronata CBS 617.96]EXJ94459.1 hypothetical protein A1O1_02855 [Capronia coronata CBS 617.96]
MEAIMGTNGANQPDWATHSSLLALLLNWNLLFIFLVVFRYLRLVVHIVSYCAYKPSPVSGSRSMTEKQCSIIIPTVDPENPHFHECLLWILTNDPLEIHIVTVGKRLQQLTKKVVRRYQAAFPSIRILVSATKTANKRQQVAHALPYVRGAITFLVDDTVFWPSPNFLRTAVAPFEDPEVGGVGTNKRVRRENLAFGFSSFWNMMGALYLERHNFEIRATNTIDGGVFVISGRTCAYRTNILQDPSFLEGYNNERFFFGLRGPLNADDDNFITRWLVTHNWKIKIQYCQDSMIETVLGTYPKFLSQCLRWSRTTWRSNTASLITDRTVYRAQPWCVYAVYLTSLVNFALFYDTALVYTLSRSHFYSPATLQTLGMCIVLSKLVKLVPYFCRHPADLIYLLGYFVFAYFHSFIKLYAGLTFWVTTWGGRDLETVNRFATEGDNDTEKSYVPSSVTGDSEQCSSPRLGSRYRYTDHLCGFSDEEELLPTPPSSSSSSSTTAQTRTHNSPALPSSTGAMTATARTSASTPSPALNHTRTPVKTPWGVVAPDRNNAYRTPANVLMHQQPGMAWPRTWNYRTRQSHGEAGAYHVNDEAAVSTQIQPRQVTPARAVAEEFMPSTPQQLLSPTRSPARNVNVNVNVDFDGDIAMDTDARAHAVSYADVDPDTPLPSIETDDMYPSPTSSCVARDRQLGVFHGGAHPKDTATTTGLARTAETTTYRLPTPPSTRLPLEPVTPTPAEGGRRRWNGYTRTWVRASPDSCNRLHFDGSSMVRPRNCTLEDRRFDYW